MFYFYIFAIIFFHCVTNFCIFCDISQSQSFLRLVQMQTHSEILLCTQTFKLSYFLWFYIFMKHPISIWIELSRRICLWESIYLECLSKWTNIIWIVLSYGLLFLSCFIWYRFVWFYSVILTHFETFTFADINN